MEKSMTGDQNSFDLNWKSRPETSYSHWTRQSPQNQIQLAFRRHWILFNKILGRPTKDLRVLEVGCGRGTMSCYFADAGAKVTLLDSSKAVIERAQQQFNEAKLSANFVVGDANQLPFAKDSFDMVFSIGLLEHFENFTQTILEQVRVLVPGGLFLGYVIPENPQCLQKDYDWINDILKVYQQLTGPTITPRLEKEKIFRSTYGSKDYLPVMEKAGLSNIQACGVYSIPMISHSTDFPFSLMPSDAEKILVRHFESILEKREKETGKDPWICEESLGQGFYIWGIKKLEH